MQRVGAAGALCAWWDPNCSELRGVSRAAHLSRGVVSEVLMLGCFLVQEETLSTLPRGWGALLILAPRQHRGHTDAKAEVGKGGLQGPSHSNDSEIQLGVASSPAC